MADPLAAPQGFTQFEQGLGDSPRPTTAPQGFEDWERQFRQQQATHYQSLPGGMALGEPGLKDVRTRMAMSFAETFAEKKKAFQERFPGAELQLTGDGTILYRMSPDDLWSKVDAGITEKFEPLQDLADFAGAVPEITGEAAMLLASRGASLPGQVARATAGAMGGHLAEEAGEAAMGAQGQTAEDIAGDTAVEGLYGAGGAIASVPISGAINAARGAGIMTPHPRTVRRERAAKRQGLPELAAHQVSINPIIRKLAGQAGATMPTLELYVHRQNEALVNAAARLGQRVRARNVKSAVANAYMNARSAIKRQLEAKAVNQAQAGKAFRQGLKEFDDAATATIDSYYKAAREIETPAFDFDNLLRIADDIERGYLAPKKGGGTVRTSHPLKREVADAIKVLRAIDPKAREITVKVGDTERTYTVTDALRYVRQTLWDLKTPNPGELYREAVHGDAGRLYKAITATLDNPVNANPKFTELWNQASEAAKTRFDVFEKSIVRELAASERPSTIARKLASPNVAPEDVALMKTIMPAEKWKTFKDYVAGDIIAHPKPVSRIAEYDKDVLETVYARPELESLGKVAAELETLKSAGMREAVRKHNRPGLLLKELVEHENDAAIDEMWRRVSKDPELREAVRAGYMSHIVKDSIRRTNEGIPTLNVNALNAHLERMRENGASKFLTFGDRRALMDLQEYAYALGQRPDSGTSLQAGEAVAGMRGLSLTAFHTLAENALIGKLMTSRGGKMFLSGWGRKKMDARGLRLLGAALGSITREMSE